MSASAAAAIAQTPAVLRDGTDRKRKVMPRPRIELSEATPNNIGTIRRLCSILFPVRYSDKFYAEVLLPEMGEFNQLCFYNDVPVGLITCKLKPPASSGPGERELYISTLGVLAPYRRQGLASRMVDYVAEAALNGVQVPAPPAPPVPGAKKSAKAPATAPTATSSGSGKTKDAPPPTVTAKITKASIHVHTGDAEAREFWERQGFEVESTVDGYYSKLQPSSAWLLVKSSL